MPITRLFMIASNTNLGRIKNFIYTLKGRKSKRMNGKTIRRKLSNGKIFLMPRKRVKWRFKFPCIS